MIMSTNCVRCITAPRTGSDLLCKDCRVKDWKENIDKMSQIDMCRLSRFAKAGHPCFDTTEPEISNYFDKKYKESGGMTPAISKLIGW